jgi:hypothetical protein
MLKNTRFVALVVAAGAVSMAHADSVDLEYTGISGGIGVTVTPGGTFSAGHMNHTIYNGATPVGSFQTFCVELGEFANNGVSTYEIVELTSAPDPDLGGSTYSQAQADAVIDVVANAVTLGWIDINLQNAGGTSAQISAIQASIWGALFGSASSTDTDVQSAIGTLSSQSLNSSTRDLMAARLRAIVAQGEQDMLYVVPLPAPLWAGLGMLGLAAGVRATRRR